jgi:hypothetical protein
MKAFSRALFTQWILAAAASLMTLLTGMLSHHPIDASYIVFVLFAALFIYRFAYYGWPVKISSIALIDRITGILTLTGMVILAFYLEERQLIGLLFTFPACLAYFITTTSWKGLRAIPFMKSIWLAIVWTIVTAVIPLNFSLKLSDIYILLERLLFMLAICIIYNLRDLRHDFESGVRTVPHRIGVPFTKAICTLILLADVTVISMHHYENYICASLIVSVLVTGLTVLFARKNGNWLYYTLLVDGSMIMQFLLVAFAVYNSV